MAIIYGKSGAEKDLLWKCPSEIRKFDDIKISLTSLRNELTCKRTNFFENLPRVITEERDWLENLKREEKDIENLWDEIIGLIKKSIEDKKIRIRKEFKIYLLLTLPLNYLDLFIKMNISKHHALRKVRNDIKVHNNNVYLFENESEQVFKSGQKELISGISRLENIIDSPEYPGAYGEISALNEL